MFTQYLSTLGQRFIAGGDWNAKHTHWGSRLITTRGRELKKSLDSANIITISTKEPTHWPTDPLKRPDLIDFYVVGGMSRHYFQTESCLDGTSNHIPIILTVSTTVILYEPTITLHNNKTDWENFRDYVNSKIDLNIKLKSEEDIEAATKNFTNLIQEACWKCTPVLDEKYRKPNNLTKDIKNKLRQKRQLRRVWHGTRKKKDKEEFNKAAREL